MKDFKLTNEILEKLKADSENALEFIVCVGIYVAGADKAMNQKEKDFIIHLATYFSSKADLRFNEFKEIIDRKNIICTHYAKSESNIKYELLKIMSILTVCDGKLVDSEKISLHDIADRINLEKETTDEIICEVVKQYETSWKE